MRVDTHGEPETGHEEELRELSTRGKKLLHRVRDALAADAKRTSADAADAALPEALDAAVQKAELSGDPAVLESALRNVTAAVANLTSTQRLQEQEVQKLQAQLEAHPKDAELQQQVAEKQAALEETAKQVQHAEQQQLTVKTDLNSAEAEKAAQLAELEAERQRQAEQLEQLNARITELRSATDQQPLSPSA